MRPFVLAFLATTVIAVPAVTAWQTAGPPPATARAPQLGQTVINDLQHAALKVSTPHRKAHR